MSDSSLDNPAEHWQSLRSLTSARIALGRTGQSIPLKESLHFKLTHAFARDAVYSSLQTDNLATSLAPLQIPVTTVHSQATSREEYLQRPDRGRRLSSTGVQQLTAIAPPASDIALIMADGLSAKAIHDHALPLLNILIPQFKNNKLQLAPLTIVEHGRVAIGDEIGALLHARLSMILIGERPGLSSPNSLGVYITYAPAIGRTDEARNCISNIRPEGLSYANAAQKIFYLTTEALSRKLTGIHLKDQSGLIS